MEQINFGTDDFAENPEPRVPCVLVLDVSGSMDGEPVTQLNDGLQAYQQALAGDSIATKRVEIAIITFGGEVNLLQSFTPAYSFTAPTLSVAGDTPLGLAVQTAMDLIEGRKKEYRDKGIGYYRPWMMLVTDGHPTDSWKHIAQKCLEAEAKKSFACFPIGVQGADLEVLRNFSSRTPLKLRELMFRELFIWLSSSQQKVSRSSPGEEVPLTNPTAPDGWATIS